MKVIKLDGRHNLYRKGYAWAFKFNSWSSEATKLELAIRKIEGGHWDMTFWGKAKDGGSRPYYVGVKKESTLTMAILSLKG